MTDATEKIRDAIANVKVVDPHCHLRVDKPSADNLGDIALYHHVWVELVSAGMDVREVSKAGLPRECADPGMDPAEGVRRALPWLRLIRNTTLGLFLRRLLEDLYGIEGGLTEANLDQALRVVEERGADRTWMDVVLRGRCGIERSISVEPGGTPYCERMAQARECAPMNLANGKLTPREVLAGCDKTLGREIRGASDYDDYLALRVEALPADDLRLVGMWLDPRMRGPLLHEDAVDSILRKAREGLPLNDAEIGLFCFYGVTRLLERIRNTPVRAIHAIVGAEVLPPHRSITQWSGDFAGGLGRIAGAFEDFHFMTSTAADQFSQDLGALAKHVPNISVAAYWWHTLYPWYIRKAIETRIDMVPMNKIVAFFSDAYHAEWCYPKLRMVKEIWGDVLTERVARGWMDVDTALDLTRMAFYENPMRICFG